MNKKEKLTNKKQENKNKERAKSQSKAKNIKILEIDEDKKIKNKNNQKIIDSFLKRNVPKKNYRFKKRKNHK